MQGILAALLYEKYRGVSYYYQNGDGNGSVTSHPRWNFVYVKSPKVVGDGGEAVGARPD